jgi:beta-glucanase (GH16 family)
MFKWSIAPIGACRFRFFLDKPVAVRVICVFAAGDFHGPKLNPFGAALRNVRKRLVAALCAAWLSALPAHAFNPNNPAASGYIETFSDEFQSIDPSVWEDNWWYDIANENACEKAYLPGTLLATPGGLDLHIQSLEMFPDCKGVARYSNAHLDSYNGFSQQYGYFEASIKSSATHGTLTAFWLLPESGAWPPELDIEEIRGDIPKTAYLTNHTGQDNKQTQFLFTAPRSLGRAFHIYGALVTRKTITWYIDGVRRGQTRRAPDEATPMFVIFSLYTGKCGDGWAGCPHQKTGWSADAYVQWLRVWKAPG